MNHIARWDGTEWSGVGGGAAGEYWPAATSLAVQGDDLYAGGWFTEMGGTPANYVARWDGSSWHALGDGTNSWIWALTVYNGDLIAGGDFTAAGEVTTDYIARWDGSAWIPVGSGVGNWVRGLGTYGSSLFAGGEFLAAGDIPSYYIARWDDPGGTDVEEQGPALVSLRLRVANPGVIGSTVPVRFSLPSAGEVQVSVHDLQGRRVATLLDGFAEAGDHSLSWRAGDAARRGVGPGIYFVRLATEGREVACKVVVTR